MKSRTRSDKRVLHIREAIARVKPERLSYIAFDPAADPRHLAHLQARAAMHR